MPRARARAKAIGSKANSSREKEDPTVVLRAKEARAMVPMETKNGQRTIGNGFQQMTGDLRLSVACVKKNRRR